jgi:multidrug efflux pump subunit AcrA (membrane-fusion protein)
MPDQQDPTSLRLRTLLKNNPRITFELGQTKLNRDDLAALDRIRALLEEGRGLLSEVDRRSSAAKAAALEKELTQLGRQIGGELRALNRRGIYVSPDNRPEVRSVTDPESDNTFQVIESVLELTVLQRDAAA